MDVVAGCSVGAAAGFGAVAGAVEGFGGGVATLGVAMPNKTFRFKLKFISSSKIPWRHSSFLT